MFVALALTVTVASARARTTELQRWHLKMQCLALAGGVGVLFLAWIAWTRTLEAVDTRALDAHNYEPAMDWLNANTREGDIVYNAQWALFPQLFFWNQHNYFIGGMDPIFEYTYDTRLYWMTTRLELGLATATTSSSPLKSPVSSQEVVDTYTALRRNFHASYLLITKNLTPTLDQYAAGDPRFQRVYDTEAISIYRLKR